MKNYNLPVHSEDRPKKRWVSFKVWERLSCNYAVIGALSFACLLLIIFPALVENPDEDWSSHAKITSSYNDKTIPQ